MKLKMYLVNKRMVILLILFSLFGVISLFAQTFTPSSVAPTSFNIDSGEKVGMMWVRLRGATSGTDHDLIYLASIDVTLAADGAFTAGDISDIQVFLSDPGDAMFNNDGSETAIDVDAVLAETTYDFTGNLTQTIHLDATKLASVVTHGGIDSSWHDLFVVFTFGTVAAADAARTVTCQVSDLKYWDADGSVGDTRLAPTTAALGTTSNALAIDDYDITAAGTDLVTGTEIEQNTADEPFLLLDFDFSNTSEASAGADIGSIKFTKQGNVSDAKISNIKLFEDTNGDNLWDAGDVVVPGGFANTVAGEFTFTPTTDIHFASGTTSSLIMTASIALVAVIGNTIGFEISDPSTDVVFDDVLAPGTTPTLSPDDLHTNQKGFIISTAALSSSALTVIAEAAPDLDPPTVAITVPADGSINVSKSSTISVAFNEAGTVQGVDISSFLVSAVAAGGSDISGTVSSPSQNVFVFTPDAEFDFNTTYYVRLASNVIGHVIEDGDNNALAANYDFSFLTGAQYPNTTKPIAVNNSILPGSSSPVVIIVPEPAGGLTTKVTVAVFTPTGKRIATLVDNRPYQDVLASPLEWFGTNGANKKLGPGIYFIVVSSKDSSETLKVRIVR